MVCVTHDTMSVYMKIEQKVCKMLGVVFLCARTRVLCCYSAVIIDVSILSALQVGFIAFIGNYIGIIMIAE